MPIQNCQVDRKPGYRYAQSGKCYVYKEGDKASQTRALNKARKQGIAQIINGFEFSLAKQKVSFDYDETLSTDKGKTLQKVLLLIFQLEYLLRTYHKFHNFFITFITNIIG